MSDDTQNKKGGDGQKKPPGNFQFPASTWLVWIVIIGSIVALVAVNQKYRTPSNLISGDEFFQKFNAGLIAHATIEYTPQSAYPTATFNDITGTYFKADKDGSAIKTNEVPFTATQVLITSNLLDKMLASNKFSAVQQNTVLFNLLINIAPFLLIGVLFWFFFIRQIKMAGKGALSFGKSKARMLAKDRNKTTFKDVAGIDEAIEEVYELVEFLKDPKKFQRLGGRIPKGVLMVGSPGTGKTLLAKAIAGEAGVPFFTISGSDFVEMFVGVGASRVRDMFEQGKKNAPCLIFIDEIDAVGRSRGTGMGGGHDEREQTLNALLVEMDGIETQEGVIIIAATNRKDVLDPALLRPGRFDREVRVNLPDVRGREQILHVHTRNVKIAKSVDLGLIARGTPGYSGAELANVVNEAALLAAKRNKDEVTQPELEEARDKVRWGRERRSMAMTEEEKKSTAYHEAGHALLNVLLPHTDALHKVSIIPRGPSLGVTMFLPEKDKISAWKREELDTLVVLMGGRVAEELFLGDVCSGAAMDIRMATNSARAMVCDWGMSEKLGMIQYGDDSSMNFFGRDVGGSRGYSEKTAEAIDAEVLHLVTTAYEKAKELISSHREAMEKITAALLEYETLDGKHIRDIIEHGRMLTPPPAPLLPPSNPTPKEPLPVNPPVKAKEDDEGMLPGLPAPA